MEKFKSSIRIYKFFIIIFIIGFLLSSCKVSKDFKVDVFETAAQGNSLKK